MFWWTVRVPVWFTSKWNISRLLGPRDMSRYFTVLQRQVTLPCRLWIWLSFVRVLSYLLMPWVTGLLISSKRFRFHNDNVPINVVNVTFIGWTLLKRLAQWGTNTTDVRHSGRDIFIVRSHKLNESSSKRGLCYFFLSAESTLPEICVLLKRRQHDGLMMQNQNGHIDIPWWSSNIILDTILLHLLIEIHKRPKDFQTLFSKLRCNSKSNDIIQ